MGGTNLAVNPIHLGLGAAAIVEPAFTGSLDWYAGYVERHHPDGVEGRLVSMFTFKDPWNMWEMHPNGAEVVLCLSGGMTLHQERADGSKQSVVLGPGEYAINEPGTWHTADVTGEARALFITAGVGTEHRPR
jgi:quercetin dioxygenase-like cupin family protein